MQGNEILVSLTPISHTGHIWQKNLLFALVASLSKGVVLSFQEDRRFFWLPRASVYAAGLYLREMF